MLSPPNGATADQLVPLLCPPTSAVGIDPRCSGLGVIVGAAYHGGVAIGGQRDGVTLLGRPNSASSDHFATLLGPKRAIPGEHPCGSGVRVIADAAHDHDIAVGG